MDIARTKQLAGLPAEDNNALYRQLTEVVQLPDDLTVDDCILRLEHCKRALSLAAKLPQPDRKKWMSASFVNLNKVRAALKRLIKADGATVSQSGTSSPTPAAPQSQTSGTQNPPSPPAA